MPLAKTMKPIPLCLACLLGLAGCSPVSAGVPSAARALSFAPVAAAAAATASTDASSTAGGIAWKKGDVDAAFAAAKAANKPVFLYWGAVWCPPCNQVKATIFNRQDFIDRSRFFVPVYIDGDSPSAQRQSARFKVVGYPTMILFKPDGTEITRLPGEVDADQYMRVLALGMNGARPVKETLAAALAPGAKLSPEEWRLLAYYSWDTDEQQALPKDKVPATLQRLAQLCPAEQRDTARRLEIKALAAASMAAGAKPREDKAAAERVLRLLAEPRFARDNFDVVVYYSSVISRLITLPKSAERAQLNAAFNAALERLAADATLSAGDRLSALDAQVALARLDAPKGALPDALLAKVREQVARVDRETTDPYARQAVISTAADVLAEAGLRDESDALLTAELKRSQSPYYYMLGLAANAKARGDQPAALDWYEKAYAAADGPATRLQWGASYVNALIDLSPQDTARIDKAAKSVIGELEPEPDTFYGRNQRALEKMSRKLAAWEKEQRGAQRDASLKRLRTQMAGVCARLPAADPARPNCDAVLHLAPAAVAKS
jgi:thiol-disulfide isomerase/thioredoxin